MTGGRVRIRAIELCIVVLMAHSAAFAGEVNAVAAASARAFPQLPLKREPGSEASAIPSFGWAALLLVAAGAAALVWRKSRSGQVPGAGWGRLQGRAATPKLLARALLTQQSSLHVVEWNGEELLLGCTSQGVSLLCRRPIEAAECATGSGGRSKGSS